MGKPTQSSVRACLPITHIRTAGREEIGFQGREIVPAFTEQKRALHSMDLKHLSFLTQCVGNYSREIFLSLRSRAKREKGSRGVKFQTSFFRSIFQFRRTERGGGGKRTLSKAAVVNIGFRKKKIQVVFQFPLPFRRKNTAAE